MDKRIRRNEICVIGLPSCDYVFSSTRMCFISYGFRDSHLEMTILRHLLEARGIQPSEAGGVLAPAQNAFCVKICSKIVTAQFCIVLANNELTGDREVPNANVHMEYGLTLGFNKYVIPFQKADQRLPFNVAGLDTIKYSNEDFERRAAEAIDDAIAKTRQDAVTVVPLDQLLQVFLLNKHMLVAAIDSPGDKAMYELGRPLGFNLLVDFAGTTYMFFGNFTALRPEVVIRRLRTIQQIIDRRSQGAISLKLKVGVTTPQQMALAQKIFELVQLWVVVTSEADEQSVVKALKDSPLERPYLIFSMEDVRMELEKLGSGIG